MATKLTVCRPALYEKIACLSGSCNLQLSSLAGRQTHLEYTLLYRAGITNVRCWVLATGHWVRPTNTEGREMRQSNLWASGSESCVALHKLLEFCLVRINECGWLWQ